MSRIGSLKRVVIVGPAHPLRGGLATFDERLAACFQEHGVKTTLLTFSLQYPNFLFPGKTQYSTDPAPAHLDIDVAVNSVNPLNWISVGNKYRKLRPDLVIFRYWMPFMAPCLGTIARRIKANGHSRMVAITDNIIPHEKHFYDKPFTNYFLKAMDGFVTMSESVLDDLNAFNVTQPRRFSPHPMYDTFGPAISKAEARQKLGLDPATNYMLFFGFIRKYKGLDLLLQAMADPGFDRNNVKLIVAGEFYEDETPYRQLIASPQLEDRVIMRSDFIPNEQVAWYFSAADIIVQPYRNATQSGVSQIAYFYEKPMLVTNVGGLSELVPHNKVGLVVEPDPADISRNLIAFYEEQKETAFLANIPEEKKRFSWEALAEQLMTVGGF